MRIPQPTPKKQFRRDSLPDRGAQSSDDATQFSSSTSNTLAGFLVDSKSAKRPRTPQTPDSVVRLRKQREETSGAINALNQFIFVAGHIFKGRRINKKDQQRLKEAAEQVGLSLDVVDALVEQTSDPNAIVKYCMASDDAFARRIRQDPSLSRMSTDDGEGAEDSEFDVADSVCRVFMHKIIQQFLRDHGLKLDDVMSKESLTSRLFEEAVRKELPHPDEMAEKNGRTQSGARRDYTRERKNLQISEEEAKQARQQAEANVAFSPLKPFVYLAGENETDYVASDVRVEKDDVLSLRPGVFPSDDNSQVSATMRMCKSFAAPNMMEPTNSTTLTTPRKRPTVSDGEEGASISAVKRGLAVFGKPSAQTSDGSPPKRQKRNSVEGLVKEKVSSARAKFEREKQVAGDENDTMEVAHEPLNTPKVNKLRPSVTKWLEPGGVQVEDKEVKNVKRTATPITQGANVKSARRVFEEGSKQGTTPQPNPPTNHGNLRPPNVETKVWNPSRKPDDSPGADGAKKPFSGTAVQAAKQKFESSRNLVSDGESEPLNPKRAGLVRGDQPKNSQTPTPKDTSYDSATVDTLPDLEELPRGDNLRRQHARKQQPRSSSHKETECDSPDIDTLPDLEHFGECDKREVICKGDILPSRPDVVVVKADSTDSNGYYSSLTQTSSSSREGKNVSRPKRLPKEPRSRENKDSKKFHPQSEKAPSRAVPKNAELNRPRGCPETRTLGGFSEGQTPSSMPTGPVPFIPPWEQQKTPAKKTHKQAMSTASGKVSQEAKREYQNLCSHEPDKTTDAPVDAPSPEHNSWVEFGGSFGQPKRNGKGSRRSGRGLSENDSDSLHHPEKRSIQVSSDSRGLDVPNVDNLKNGFGDSPMMRNGEPQVHIRSRSDQRWDQDHNKTRETQEALPRNQKHVLQSSSNTSEVLHHPAAHLENMGRQPPVLSRHNQGHSTTRSTQAEHTTNHKSVHHSSSEVSRAGQFPASSFKNKERTPKTPNAHPSPQPHRSENKENKQFQGFQQEPKQNIDLSTKSQSKQSHSFDSRQQWGMNELKHKQKTQENSSKSRRYDVVSAGSQQEWTEFPNSYFQPSTSADNSGSDEINPADSNPEKTARNPQTRYDMPPMDPSLPTSIDISSTSAHSDISPSSGTSNPLVRPSIDFGDSDTHRSDELVRPRNRVHKPEPVVDDANAWDGSDFRSSGHGNAFGENRSSGAHLRQPLVNGQHMGGKGPHNSRNGTGVARGPTDTTVPIDANVWGERDFRVSAGENGFEDISKRAQVPFRPSPIPGQLMANSGDVRGPTNSTAPVGTNGWEENNLRNSHYRNGLDDNRSADAPFRQPPRAGQHMGEWGNYNLAHDAREARDPADATRSISSESEFEALNTYKASDVQRLETMYENDQRRRSTLEKEGLLSNHGVIHNPRLQPSAPLASTRGQRVSEIYGRVSMQSSQHAIDRVSQPLHDPMPQALGTFPSSSLSTNQESTNGIVIVQGQVSSLQISEDQVEHQRKILECNMDPKTGCTVGGVPLVEASYQPMNGGPPVKDRLVAEPLPTQENYVQQASSRSPPPSASELEALNEFLDSYQYDGNFKGRPSSTPHTPTEFKAPQNASHSSVRVGDPVAEALFSADSASTLSAAPNMDSPVRANVQVHGQHDASYSSPTKESPNLTRYLSSPGDFDESVEGPTSPTQLRSAESESTVDEEELREACQRRGLSPDVVEVIINQSRKEKAAKKSLRAAGAESEADYPYINPDAPIDSDTCQPASARHLRKDVGPAGAVHNSNGLATTPRAFSQPDPSPTAAQTILGALQENAMDNQNSRRASIASMPGMPELPEGATEEELNLLNRFIEVSASNFDGKRLSADSERRVRAAALKVGLSQKFVDQLLEQASANNGAMAAAAPIATVGVPSSPQTRGAGDASTYYTHDMTQFTNKENKRKPENTSTGCNVWEPLESLAETLRAWANCGAKTTTKEDDDDGSSISSVQTDPYRDELTKKFQSEKRAKSSQNPRDRRALV
eukprot:Nitzschia sp. Nitz4//scaffold70_size99833//37274//43294//NITZ4_004594-RA/size99833-processed-gene-0.9-mRNA-1//1//CDS//3329557132//1948//frame0